VFIQKNEKFLIFNGYYAKIYIRLTISIVIVPKTKKKGGRLVPENRQTEKRTKGEVALEVFNIILCVILSLITICNVVIIIKGMVHPDQPPALFGISPMLVSSDVMSGDAEGCLEAGDLAFVKKSTIEELEIGDTVVFYSDLGIPVLGRAQEKNEYGYVVKGDNMKRAYTELLTEENYWGNIGFSIGGFGKLATFVRSIWGILILMVLPIGACIGLVVWDIIQTKKSQEQTEEEEEEKSEEESENTEEAEEVEKSEAAEEAAQVEEPQGTEETED